MPQRLDVSPHALPDDRFAVVVSKYNSDITDRLCEAALAALESLATLRAIDAAETNTETAEDTSGENPEGGED